MSHVFSNCNSLVSLPDISKWNLINVKYSTFNFLGCNSIVSLPKLNLDIFNKSLIFDENCIHCINFQ